MTELKACPFCGATESEVPRMGYVSVYQSSITGCFQVHCYKCNTSSDWCETERKAINKWNRRYTNQTEKD